MINPEELRIGNFVHHLPIWSYRNEKCSEFDFQWEDTDWYNIGECTLDLESIVPIPIDKVWLLKLGYKHAPDCKEYELFLINQPNSEGTIAHKSGVYINKFGDFFDWESGKPVKHVHTLQNIAFYISDLILNPMPYESAQ